MAIVSNVITTTGNIIHRSTGSTAVTVLYLCNRSTANAQVNLHIVANGSVISGNNIIYNTLLLSGQDTYVVDTEKLLLDNGDALVGVAVSGSNNIVATCSFTSI